MQVWLCMFSIIHDRAFSNRKSKFIVSKSLSIPYHFIYVYTLSQMSHTYTFGSLTHQHMEQCKSLTHVQATWISLDLKFLSIGAIDII